MSQLMLVDRASGSFMHDPGRGNSRFIQDQSLQSETSSLQHDLRQSGLWRLHIWERILSPLT
jgi:hypothetical protein